MENQLNNIKACWNRALYWEDALYDYEDECESQGRLPNAAYREELRTECNNFYERYRALADHFIREHGGSIAFGEWNLQRVEWKLAA